MRIVVDAPCRRILAVVAGATALWAAYSLGYAYGATDELIRALGRRAFRP